MKHSINELYTLHNYHHNPHLATRKFVESQGLPIGKSSYHMRGYDGPYAVPTPYLIHHSDEVKVADKDGIKIVFLFGEKTWFDTQEELNEHRAQYQIERQALIERTKIKKAILQKLENMTTNELIEVLKKI